ncbi:hypothetical protein [Bacillus sp. M6-12]|uniref:hypothetical protein n=1 Tax=Bacillus sp. M6-12 TaxID=2054166 RepID=UPI0015E15035|nr:hypothetical protein [Bacillus sp. M6-12]
MVYRLQKSIRTIGSTETFNYKFVRWNLGAYSKELHEDIHFLLQKELIEKSSFQLTEKAKGLVEKNHKFIQIFFHVKESDFDVLIQTLKEMNIQELLLQTYEKFELNTRPMGKVIEDIMYDPEYVGI